MSVRHPVTLAVDIGGTGIKGMLLDWKGRPISERVREKTPRPATPAKVLGTVASIGDQLAGFDRVSVGFPGVVELGVVRTAANLHPAWIGQKPGERLAARLGKPVRVANDADVQGLGIVEGVGVELVITLGTGVGSALFHEHRLIPNLELGHHPFRRGQTYEQQLGDRTLGTIGRKRWKRRVRRAVEVLLAAFNCRRLYLGGGNARLVGDGLPPRVRVVSNLAGLLGGIHLWVGEDPARPGRSR